MNNYLDYYSIRTIFDLHTMIAKSIKKRNWDKTNVVALQKILNKEIIKKLALTLVNDVFNNFKNELNVQVNNLARAIKAIIEVFTSLTRICSKFKTSFTKKCKEVLREVKRHRRT